MNDWRFSPRAIWAFAQAHWKYALLVPLWMMPWTTLHESMHALAMLAQGGEIVAFNALPSVDLGPFSFGYVRTVPPDHSYSERLVHLAPALFALAVFPLGRWLTWRAKSKVAQKVLFISLMILPLFELSMSEAGLWMGQTFSDHYAALRGYELYALVIDAVLIAVLGPITWRTFQRILPATLSRFEFTVCLVAGLLAPLLRYTA